MSFKLKNKKLEVDLRYWMRPKQAIQKFKSKGVKITPQKLYYWIKEDKIKSKKIKELDDLVLVDIRTSPYGEAISV